MGINLKHDEYERLIRQLAGHRGSSITDAIGIAVRHELEREGVLPAPETFRDRACQAGIQAHRGDQHRCWIIVLPIEIIGL